MAQTLEFTPFHGVCVRQVAACQWHAFSNDRSEAEIEPTTFWSVVRRSMPILCGLQGFLRTKCEQLVSDIFDYISTLAITLDFVFDIPFMAHLTIVLIIPRRSHPEIPAEFHCRQDYSSAQRSTQNQTRLSGYLHAAHDDTCNSQ